MTKKVAKLLILIRKVRMVLQYSQRFGPRPTHTLNPFHVIQEVARMLVAAATDAFIHLTRVIANSPTTRWMQIALLGALLCWQLASHSQLCSTAQGEGFPLCRRWKIRILTSPGRVQVSLPAAEACKLEGPARKLFKTNLGCLTAEFRQPHELSRFVKSGPCEFCIIADPATEACSIRKLQRLAAELDIRWLLLSCCIHIFRAWLGFCHLFCTIVKPGRRPSYLKTRNKDTRLLSGEGWHVTSESLCWPEQATDHEVWTQSLFDWNFSLGWRSELRRNDEFGHQRTVDMGFRCLARWSIAWHSTPPPPPPLRSPSLLPGVPQASSHNQSAVSPLVNYVNQLLLCSYISCQMHPCQEHLMRSPWTATYVQLLRDLLVSIKEEVDLGHSKLGEELLEYPSFSSDADGACGCAALADWRCMQSRQRIIIVLKCGIWLSWARTVQYWKRPRTKLPSSVGHHQQCWTWWTRFAAALALLHNAMLAIHTQDLQPSWAILYYQGKLARDSSPGVTCVIRVVKQCCSLCSLYS